VERDELRERIRRLTFASPALARAFSRGDFRSIFRGRGIEFDSLRDYCLDDDSRLIDWSATARAGRPFVRTYREDRSLALMLLVDASRSMDQGSGELSKLDMAVLASSLVAYAAQLREMPVGCLVFARTVLRELAPRRGKAHALAVAEAALNTERLSRSAAALTATASRAADEGGPGLSAALRAAAAILKRRSLVLVLSDFRDSGWARPLGELRRAHDVVAVRITDRSDLHPPERGSFRVADPETGEAAWLPLGSRAFRARWERSGRDRRSSCLDACAAQGVPALEIDASDDPVKRLLGFFERRRKA
jgi:uncharacterized protein (DUF58 family)